MSLVRSARFQDATGSAADRQTASLAALALLLGLVTAGLYVVDALRATAALQDCLLTGRPDCPAQAMRPLTHP